jgi:hypothetical protein
MDSVCGIECVNAKDAPMTYDEAVEATVTREEARREIERHDCEGWQAFLTDEGDHDEYAGADVLGWLGY